MPEQVNIGFVGCGGNARGHMASLLKLPDAKLVAVCDVVEELARRAADETGAEAYTDHRKMLERTDLHAIYLSLPVFAHGQPEFDTIERGLPFLAEKPVAIDMDTAREIEARVNKAGLITQVGYQLRYGGTVDLAKEILAGQRVGLVTGQYWCNSGEGDPTRWLRQMAKSGGQLVEQATHTVDMMRYLGGEVTEVFCSSTNQVLKGIDCPDFNAVSFKFASGAVGSLTTSWAYAQDWSHANVVEILFENAGLRWTHGKLSVARDGKVEELEQPGPTIDEVFVNAVKTGDGSAIRSPYSDGVKTLALTLAMNESARTGQPVRLAA
jgi:predicted dehydrogenase